MKLRTKTKSTGNDEKKKLTFDIPANLHLKFKLLCIKNEVTMGAWLCDKIEKTVER